MSRASTRTIRLRRSTLLVLSAALPLALVLWGGHWGVHVARNLLFPGAGLVDHYWWLALLCALAAIAATMLWLAWGTGWLVLLTAVISGVLSALMASGSHTGSAVGVLVDPRPVALAHEFPLVVLVVTALVWLRSTVVRLPLLRRIATAQRGRRGAEGALSSLGPVDRSRAISLIALGGDDPAALTSQSDFDDICRRARRVSVVARARLRDPLGRDHAYARSAAHALKRLSTDERLRLEHEALRSPLGVPCSEPSWIRPLDATITALLLQHDGCDEPGRRWEQALVSRFALRRGHRPAWWWTPLDLGAGSAAPWEHAAFTALSRAAGWLGDEDWSALRRRAMGAAARGAEHPDDERLVAAARIWLAFVEDDEARRIVMRPGVRRDALACALDGLARRLCDNRDLLRSVSRSPGGGGAPT